jgi:hypothetical protein
MCIEVLRNTILWNRKSKTPKGSKKHLRIGTQFGSCFHNLKNMPKLTWCHDYMSKIMYFSITLIRCCISSLLINHVWLLCNCRSTNCTKVVGLALNSKNPSINAYASTKI